MIHVSFRFDDLSSLSDHVLEREILAAFTRHRVPLTAAVIPCSMHGDGTTSALNTDAASHVIEAYQLGIVEVAQHGHVHSANSRTDKGIPSEFAGLDARAQRERVELGGDILTRVFGARPTGFIPPWNTYDSTTVRVLVELKYRYVSGGWTIPQTSGLLATLPHTCWLHNLRAAVNEARRFGLIGPRMVAVFHDYDFRECDPAGRISIAVLDEILGWARSQKDLSFSSLAEAAATPPSSFALRLRQRRSKLPWRLRWLIPEYSLLDLPFRRRPAFARLVKPVRKVSG